MQYILKPKNPGWQRGGVSNKPPWAPGSDKTQGQGLLTKSFKKKRTVHLTRFLQVSLARHNIYKVYQYATNILSFHYKILTSSKS